MLNEFSKLHFLSYESLAIYCQPHPRLVHDYELDFHYFGNSIQTIDGKNYDVTRGTMVFRRPGQISYLKGDYYCRMITFDLSGEVVKKYGRQHRLRTTPLQEVSETPLLDLVPPVFIPAHGEDLTELFKRTEIYSRQYDGGKTELLEKLDETLLELLLLLCSDAMHERAKCPEPLDDSVFKTCRYIDKECHREIRIDGLAHMVGMSADHLTRLFRHEIGVTPSEYIYNARMKKARFLLESTDSSIDTIASQCGYQSTAYFIKRFRDDNGMTPKKYRASVFKERTDSYLV